MSFFLDGVGVGVGVGVGWGGDVARRSERRDSRFERVNGRYFGPPQKVLSRQRVYWIDAPFFEVFCLIMIRFSHYYYCTYATINVTYYLVLKTSVTVNGNLEL